MLYKKHGLPEKGEYLICTVKKILPHSIFVDLDEYKEKEGYIHISEIAPGRIRNIRDYVKEGKRIVCKVLDVNQEKGYIDLSLRRVPESKRLEKNEENKQEERAEKILETVAKNSSTTLEDVYKRIQAKIDDEYGLLNNFLQAIAIEGVSVLKDVNLPEKIAAELLKVVKDKIKQQTVSVSYNIDLSCNEPAGINIIKDAFKQATIASKEHSYDVKITYISAPRYRMIVKSDDYKSAEKIASELGEIIVSSVRKNKGSATLIKVEK